jgi:hypothetical protein
MDCNSTVQWTAIGVAAAAIVFGFAFMFMNFLASPDKDKPSDLEHRRMYFAYGALMTMAILLVIAAALYVASEGEGSAKEVFDSFTKILPPIATLVLGYYFGTTRSSRDT